MSPQTDCLLCSFENPKLTATAIVIKDGALLVVKRNEEPFKGEWDFVGGYLQKGETPGEGLHREIQEELGVASVLTYIGAFTGTATYKESAFPVLSFVYLTELTGEIRLDAENSEFAWMPIASLDHVAFDSNRKVLAHIKKKFTFDLARVRELVQKLDASAVVSEQSLYRAILDGYISTIEEDGKLVGMGWIFPRQTMLRRQAVVEDMIVDDAYRGRGYGEKILLDLLRWAKEEGIEVVELTTNPLRVAANALYQKVGFKLHETNHYLLDFRTP